MKIEGIVNDSEVLYTSDEIKVGISNIADTINEYFSCLLYTSPSPRDAHESRMPSSA